MLIIQLILKCVKKKEVNFNQLFSNTLFDLGSKTLFT